MAPANQPDPQAQKQALIIALNEHRMNTIGELRRVERIFATLGSPDLTQPMTAACTLETTTAAVNTALTLPRVILCQLEQLTLGTSRPDQDLPFQVRLDGLRIVTLRLGRSRKVV